MLVLLLLLPGLLGEYVTNEVCVRVCSSRSNALLVSPSFLPTTPTAPLSARPSSSTVRILSGCISPAFRMHEVKPLSCWLSLDLDLGLVS